MITVTFACGERVESDGIRQPTCACGCGRIVRVTAPAPRFTGLVAGPSAEAKDLEPKRLNLATEPMTLKTPKDLEPDDEHR